MVLGLANTAIYQVSFIQGLADLLVLQTFDEVSAYFNIKVGRFLLPIAMAVRVMRPSLDRLAEYWGLPSLASDTQSVFDLLQTNIYTYGDDFAFS